MFNGRKVICLCGSTKFKKEYELVSLIESINGNIILSVGAFGYADNLPITIAEKLNLDELHLDKIALSDLVIVIDVDGYIGESTRSEINYAGRCNNPIVYYSQVEDDYKLQYAEMEARLEL